MDKEDLQSQIDELKRRLDEKDKQQITYPLDYMSVQILSKYFMHITDTILTIGGIAGKVFTDYIGKQDDKSFDVSENIYVQYHADPTTNIITTVPGTRFRFVDNEQVYFTTEDTFPNPLDGITTYYVISASADQTSFKVSTSVGGSEVNITNVGVGKQYVFYL